jgi:hypothetical protein
MVNSVLPCVEALPPLPRSFPTLKPGPFPLGPGSSLAPVQLAFGPERTVRWDRCGSVPTRAGCGSHWARAGSVERQTGRPHAVFRQNQMYEVQTDWRCHLGRGCLAEPGRPQADTYQPAGRFLPSRKKEALRTAGCRLQWLRCGCPGLIVAGTPKPASAVYANFFLCRCLKSVPCEFLPGDSVGGDNVGSA